MRPLASPRASAASRRLPFAVQHPLDVSYRVKLSNRIKNDNSGIPRASKIEPGFDDDDRDLRRRRLPRSLSFHLAEDSASLRAAASLRAHAFSTNLPPTASDYARQVYVKERTREAWEALERRRSGTDDDYRGCVCLCLLGTIEDLGSRGDEGDGGEEADLSRAVREAGDASCTLAPLDDRSRRRRLAVASLDVIVGRRLPSEALVAESGGDDRRVAYLANVAVSPPARRRGVGVALLSRAIGHVSVNVVPSDPSVGRIAVHAEARNGAARALYEHASLGFRLEKEEGAREERGLGRPRRVLYSRAVRL